MDSPPRMPLKHCHRLMGRSATNEVPKSIRKEREERLTPPLEIFVRELSSLSGHSKSGSGDNNICHDSAITFDGSMMESGNCNLSVTSDVSSLVDQVHQQQQQQNISNNDIDIIHPSLMMAAGSGSGDRCRLPPRRQSSRRPRTNRRHSRKGVMRWASMPMSNPHCTGRQHEEENDNDDDNSPNSVALDGSHTHTIDTPRLPQRRDSNPSIFGSDDDDNDSEDENDKRAKNMNNNSDKEMPRLPTRKKSSESLFSSTKVKAASSSEGGSDEVVVGAHAA